VAALTPPRPPGRAHPVAPRADCAAESVRQIIARAARLAIRDKRGAARRCRLYMAAYLRTRALAIRIREAK